MTIPCHDCPLYEKVHVCCGRHPETGRRAMLKIAGNRAVLVCPNLDENGLCRIYRERPLACRQYFCERFDSGFEIYAHKWLEDVFPTFSDP